MKRANTQKTLNLIVTPFFHLVNINTDTTNQILLKWRNTIDWNDKQRNYLVLLLVQLYEKQFAAKALRYTKASFHVKTKEKSEFH